MKVITNSIFALKGLFCMANLKMQKVSVMSTLKSPFHCRAVQGWNWGLLSRGTCSVNITLNFAHISYFINFLINLILFVGIQICSICFWSLPTVQYQIVEEWCNFETFFNPQNYPLNKPVGLPFLCQLFHARFKSHIQLFKILKMKLLLSWGLS